MTSGDGLLWWFGFPLFRFDSFSCGFPAFNRQGLLRRKRLCAHEILGFDLFPLTIVLGGIPIFSLSVPEREANGCLLRVFFGVPGGLGHTFSVSRD